MYIPDYRKETDKLSEKDRAFVEGFRAAIAAVGTFFDNLDVYDLDDGLARKPEEIREAVLDWLGMGEKETVLALFDNADYLPADTELTDASRTFR